MRIHPDDIQAIAHALVEPVAAAIARELLNSGLTPKQQTESKGKVSALREHQLGKMAVNDLAELRARKALKAAQKEQREARG